MVFRTIFPSLYPPEDNVPSRTRNATLYLLRCVRFMGILQPPKRYFIIYCVWSLVLNATATIYQPISLALGIVNNISEFSPGEFLTSVQVTINVWALAIKVIIVWIWSKRLDRALAILDEMDKWLTHAAERRHIHRAVSNSNRVFFLFMTVYMLYATSTFVSSVFGGHPPYQNYYPKIDWRASKFQFWLQSLLEYFAMAGAVFQDACVDCYPLNFVIPLRAHINVFEYRLRQLRSTPDVSNDEHYEQLVQCIKDHKVILSYADVMSPIISGTIFVQFLVVGIVLGLTLINIMLFADLASGLAALCFLIAVLLETTPFSLLCNHLNDDCIKLADALFESNWIDAEERYKKSMLQFMLRLQDPIVFKALNVFPILVGTNISVTKFAFSVFTFVKQMNIAEKLTRPKEMPIELNIDNNLSIT